MLKFRDLPDCLYPSQPVTVIRPSGPTPKHSLYLSNLDDQKFLRFSIKYLYLFKKSVSFDVLKSSLSRVLVDYYPLAGRLRSACGGAEDDRKLEVDCNGEGAVFAEASMDITAEELVELSQLPNKSWRKLLYKVEAQTFLDIPPLVVQVTSLRCGGMILCTAISHSLCDGIGTSQFLHAWAHAMTKPNIDQLIIPFHTRHVLNPRRPPQVNFPHPGYTKNTPTQVDVIKLLQSQPVVPKSITFTSIDVLRLKKLCVPWLKCTAFEALATHTWRSWVRALDLGPTLNVKLLFSINIRRKLNPELPDGYYGNGFVLGCAESTVKDLVASNMRHGVKLVQQAKATLDDEHVRSMVDLLEDKTVKTDLSASLVISQWSKLGLEEVDFGEGKPLHMGSLVSDIYCLFLPVIGDSNAVRVQVSVPENMAENFEYYMRKSWQNEENGDVKNGYHPTQENGLI